MGIYCTHNCTHLATVTVILRTVQMIGLYRDPTGENVFQNVGATVTNENDLIALRRDVEQLRVSLHLAKVLCNAAIVYAKDQVPI